MGGRGEEVGGSRSPICAFPGISLPQPAPSCSGPGKDKSETPCSLTTTESSQGSARRRAGPGARERGPLTVALHLPGPQLLQAPCPMGSPPFSLSCVCPAVSAPASVPSPPPFSLGWDPPSCLLRGHPCPQTHLCPCATQQLHFLLKKKKMFSSYPRVCNVHSQPIQVRFQ